MVNCAVKNWQGEEVGQANLDFKVAKEENAAHIVHRALVRQLNNARQGTSSTKTRAEVRGVDANLGVKKELAGQELVQSVPHYGKVAVSSLAPNPKNTTSK